MSGAPYHAVDGYTSALEHISCLLSEPWIRVTTVAVLYYIDSTHKQEKADVFRCFIVGPFMLALSCVLFPLALIGYLMWVARCVLGYEKRLYRYTENSIQDQLPTDTGASKSSLTFLTANVILSPDVFVKLNNIRKDPRRLEEIARRLVAQQPTLNTTNNLTQATANLAHKTFTVTEQVPWVDVMLIQEVFGYTRGAALAHHLRPHYPYCVYDVAHNSLGSNLCLIGSGLFVASRLQVLAVNFRAFSNTSSYGRCLSYGTLILKLQVSTQDKTVAYVTNIHTQAYDETLLASQLTEARLWTDTFVAETLGSQETKVCQVLGGDFNCDNMSSADAMTRHHSLWGFYQDACRRGPGVDQPWAIGTELRQRKLHLRSSNDPQALCHILRDEVERRSFIIDANVQKHTLELMTCDPEPDENGQIVAVSYGGARRIDYLLLQREVDEPSSKCLQRDKEHMRDYFRKLTASRGKFPAQDNPKIDDGSGKIRTLGSSVNKCEGISKNEQYKLSGLTKRDIKRKKSTNEGLYGEDGSGETGFERLYAKRFEELNVEDFPVIASVWFTTALAGLSDHLPYIMQVKIK